MKNSFAGPTSAFESLAKNIFTRPRIPFPLRAAFIRMALLMAAAQLPAQTIYTPYSFTNLAGLPGTLGSSDGVGSGALFDFPQGVAVDAAGNIFVGDTQNQIIRKITPDGTVTTIAGTPSKSGYADGFGLGTPKFNLPIGLAMDSQSNLYVGDTDNETIRKITPSGVVTTLAGTPGMVGSSNGPAASALFDQPAGVAVDSAGNVYVADQINRIVRKISTDLTVTNFAGTLKQMGTNDGLPGTGQFSTPLALTVDGSFNVYVVDSGGNSIRKITPYGNISTLAGGHSSGTNDGAGAAAQFSNPQGIALDAGGDLFVTDLGNDTIRMITPGGSVSTIAGTPKQSGLIDGTNAVARFNDVRGIVVDSSTNIFVDDANAIRQITPIGTNWVVTTLAGTNNQGTVDGTNGVARFSNLYGMTRDSAGNLYSIDRNNDVIRKITPSGQVTAFAGTPGTTGANDGTGCGALFNQPGALAIDSSTNIYVADTINFVVRKISPSGTNWVVTTLAGDATVNGTNDATGNAALFGQVHGVAVDSSQNVYATDLQHFTIRKIDTNGQTTTFAGSPGKQGDVDATGNAARFNDPIGITSDGVNLFVVDSISIREISSDGAVTTIAGCPTGGCTNSLGSTDGAGFTARFAAPVGIAVDTSGNLYVADQGNDEIRQLVGSGTNWNVTTLAGVAGMAGYSNGVGDTVRFGSPMGVAVDSAGNVYVADTAQYNIAKGSAAAASTPPLEFDTTSGSIVISGGSLHMRVTGPSTGSFILQTSTNLLNWTPIQTNSLSPGEIDVTALVTTNNQQFFRLALGP